MAYVGDSGGIARKVTSVYAGVEKAGYVMTLGGTTYGWSTAAHRQTLVVIWSNNAKPITDDMQINTDVTVVYADKLVYETSGCYFTTKDRYDKMLQNGNGGIVFYAPTFILNSNTSMIEAINMQTHAINDSVASVAHRIVKGYASVDGVAKQIYSSNGGDE